jgi:LytS/YehU family sensor histidine kinase
MIGGMYAIRHAVYGALGMRYHHPSWSFVVLYESIKLALFFGLWLGLFFAFNSFRALQGERQRLLMMEKSVGEARLAQLQSQLHPHFFFNVLNTISALMHVDVQRADRLVARMGDFLRATLRADQQLWPLAEELRLLRLYADIMLERFEERVELTWNIAPDIEGALVPVLLLQPLMENAFRHSVEKTSDHVPILVRAESEGSGLTLEIRNAGILNPHSQGVGLRNVRERLNVIFGLQAQFSLVQDASDVRALIRMPLQRT